MKKQWMIIASAILVTGAVACNSDNTTDTDATLTTTETPADDNYTTGSYVDLNTGNTVEMRVHKDTRVATPTKPGSGTVTYYVNPATSDTIEASTGRIVSGALVHNNDSWTVDETKIKIDSDGSYKEKTEDSKYKVDADGSEKYKDGDVKIKKDEDGLKIKTDDKKIKVKDGEMKIKNH